MTRVLRAGRVTFAALSVRNYRRYYGGQAVSLIGTWMQMTAQSWLVLSLTHSGAALGAVVALQTLPVLLLAPYGGVIADRLDKRKLMIALQSAMGIQALILGLLTVTGLVRVWEIGLLAGVLDGRASPIESVEGTVAFARKILDVLDPPTLFLSSNSDLELLPRDLARRKVLRLGEVSARLKEEVR